MRIVLIALLTLFSVSSYSQTQQFTLKNGLKIVVREDHRAPIAVSMVWYNVGSADETGGSTGLAHALEHLMFKGTENHPLGEFSKTVAGIGGQENAFTNNDYTAYFEKIAAPHLATSFELEADRMQNLILDKEEFAKELKVIQEERRLRTDDDPQALTFERFLSTAHLASAYQHPVIGWMTDLEHMKVEDTQNWYDRFYAPNNATLIVVGDVNPQEVYKLAEKYFGKIPTKTLPNRKPQIEPPRLGKKTVLVNAPAQVPLIMLGFTVPSVASVDAKHSIDPYALELIAGILDAGDSGRFTKNLVRKTQIASIADVYYNLYSRNQTQFIIFGSPTQNHTVDDLRAELLKEIEILKTETISPEDLKRVKTQIIAQKTFERDSIFGQAMELGLLETIGLGWQTTDKYIERISSITPVQVQKTAQQYLQNNHLTEAQLIPEP